MARARNIKPSFFQNPELVELRYEVRLLFIGLWTIADRDGRIEDRPKKIKMELFPADDIDINQGLSDLHASGFVLRYEVDKLQIIQIVNFSKHQKPHHQEKKSELPEPPISEPVRTKERLNRADSLNPLTDSLNPNADALNPITSEPVRTKERTNRADSGGQFRMHLDWEPEIETWQANCFRSGVGPDYKKHIHEFRLYWQNRDDRSNELGWQGKLIQNIKSQYQKTKIVHGQSGGQGITDEARQRIAEQFSTGSTSKS